MDEQPVFFHGGKPGFYTGDRILPPSVTGATPVLDWAIVYQPDLAERAACNTRPDRVFLTTNEDAAIVFAALWPHNKTGGWVYTVTPVGPVEADPDYHGPDPTESVMAAEAVIVARRPLTRKERIHARKLAHAISPTAR